MRPSQYLVNNMCKKKTPKIVRKRAEKLRISLTNGTVIQDFFCLSLLPCSFAFTPEIDPFPGAIFCACTDQR